MMKGPVEGSIAFDKSVRKMSRHVLKKVKNRMAELEERIEKQEGNGVVASTIPVFLRHHRR